MVFDILTKLGLAKYFLFFIGLLFAVFAAAAITFAFAYRSIGNSYIQNKSVYCTTPICIRLAADILSKMDQTVDPCDDFYQFSCGNYIKTEIIPYNHGTKSSFDDIEKKIKDRIYDVLMETVDENSDTSATQQAKIFYQSCMFEEDAQNQNQLKSEMRAFIKNRLGGWPMAETNTSEYKNNTKELVTRVVDFTRMEFFPFFQLNVFQNSFLDKNSSFYEYKYTLEIRPRKQQYIYKTRLTQIIRQLYPNSNMDTAVLSKQIEDMLSLEETLNSPDLKKRELSESTIFRTTSLTQALWGSQSEIMNISQLANTMPNFDWIQFLNGLYGQQPSKEINNGTYISIISKEKIKKTLDIVANASHQNPIDLQNYIVWYFLRTHKDLLPELWISTTTMTRDVICTNLVKTYIPHLVARLYVSKYFNRSEIGEIISIVENLRAELIKEINSSSWIDDSSKKMAIKKAEKIKTNVAYPAFTFNDTYMDLQYNFSFQYATFLQNCIALSEKKMQETLDTIINQQQIWGDNSALTVNEFYDPLTNDITLTAAFLQTPFFVAGAPGFYNYGAIGSVIGHELNHGFDSSGRQFNERGQFFQDGIGLWSNESIAAYKTLSECYVDQYNNYTVLQVNHTVNGLLTLRENIADNCGLKQSFKAYEKLISQHEPEILLPGLIFNQKQLFFISFAQNYCSKETNKMIEYYLNDAHSPHEFRVIGVTSNSEEFMKTFKCNQNQNNNQKEKCKIW